MNKRLKTLVSGLIVSVMGITLGACQPKDIETPVETPVVETPVEVGAVKVTDDLGREVVFEKTPERLVSGYYITSSMLMALGLTDKVVGIEAKAESRPLYALAAPELLKVPNVGTAKEFNLEGALALKSDLLVVPIRLKDVIATMEGLEVKALGVNPESFADMEEVLTMLGKATGTIDRAKEIISYNQELLAKAKALAGKASDEEKATVYFGGNSSFLTTAGGKMHQSSLMEEAGALNVAKELEDSYWAEVSYEQILSWQPDYILIASDASYTVEDVLKDPVLSDLMAIKEKKVYKLPSNIESWDSPIPASVLGVLAICSYLYEEKYDADMLKADVVAYYEKFYDFTFTEELK
jgi:iron complex transport system substrate-binding protein